MLRKNSLNYLPIIWHTFHRGKGSKHDQKNVFRFFLKEERESIDRIDTGRSYQTFGEAAQKE